MVAKEFDPEDIGVRKLMERDLFVVHDSEDNRDAIQRIRCGVRRLPVVSPDGALVGGIAPDDLLEFLADELIEIARVSSRRRYAERQRRA